MKYALRCRNGACRHRRLSDVHPDDYKVVPACSVCGDRKGWRIENQAVDKRPLCECGGVMGRASAVRHKMSHPMCLNNPKGMENHLRARGVPETEIFDHLPLDMTCVEIKEDEPCPF